jgi:signal transduction histidine kinase/ActR/RegA family two-component response regulator
MLPDLFLWGELPVNRFTGLYDSSLVLLSIAIAFIASYVTLDLVTQMRRETIPRLVSFWHVAGAVVFGAGIWAMHFTGMLAYHMQMEHHYALSSTLISLLVPILIAAIVFQILRQPVITLKTVFLTAPFLGLGIASMHYIGMAAMEMHATMQYIPGLFALSIIVAIVSSGAALWLMFVAARMSIAARATSAAIMAAGISGMHYIAMQATVIVPFAETRLGPEFDDMNLLLAFGVTTITLLIVGIAFAALTINQKVTRHLKEEVANRTEELQASTEALRIAKDEAEEANLAKSEFLANMSHEIRTPINAVVGIANILNADMLPPEKRGQYLNTLQISAESLLSLINELLDISKIETNKIEIEAVPFNLHELIEEVMLLISVRANEKGLNLNLDYDPTLPLQFVGDSLRIRQILVNLMSNAVKFTEKGVIAIHVNGTQDATGKIDLRLRVRDSGIGIPANKLGEIFDKFIQADTSTSRKYGGTGLGLSISRGLAERMGGSISVASQLGKGSEFTLHLPLPVAQQALPSAEKATAKVEYLPDLTATQPIATIPEAPPSEQARILLVEDNAANILVAKSYLDIFGFHYAIAHHGKEAVEMHTAQPFDVILMDVQMPIMDGYEATKRIREWERSQGGRHTPIIAMTSHGRVEDRARCLRNGMDEYISKPFRPEDLKEKILHMIEHPEAVATA